MTTPDQDRLDDARPVRFGVVTPTLNAERYLEETLRSIWRQRSELVEIEHVLVDGGSTDRTVEIAERYPTKVIVATDDRGMYDAINRGLPRRKECRTNTITKPR